MTTIPDTIENPVTGERIRFLESTPERLVFALEVRPGGFVASAHLHPLQEETFAIAEGSLLFRIGRDEVKAEPGDAIRLPRGVPHTWRQLGEGPVRCTCTLTPALEWEHLFRHVFAAAHRDDADPRTGFPPLCELLRILAAFPDHAYAPFPPPALQKAAARLLYGRGAAAD